MRLLSRKLAYLNLARCYNLPNKPTQHDTITQKSRQTPKSKTNANGQIAKTAVEALQ
jgi:hypothetical protein